jgi:hypothetical protein
MWYAVELEGRPLAVLPCRNKKPCCPGGHLAATADPEEIARLFGRYPTAPQIGVATGVIGGIDVLDVDVKHGGMNWLEENRHRLPMTRVHSTPSGGQHWLFRHATGLRGSTSKIAPGIDVRADGNLVVWWPAQHYPVQDAPVADWPTWLLALAHATPQRPSAMPISRNGGDGPLMSPGNHEIPKVLYDMVCKVTSHTTPFNKRRVIGVLRTALQKPEHEQNDGLNWSSFRCRELIEAGIVTRENARALLFKVADLNGYSTRDGIEQTARTICSGLGPLAGHLPQEEEEDQPVESPE